MPDMAFGELLSHAIGGGWGYDSPGDDTTLVRVVRGADFPSVSGGKLSEAPLRHESARKVPSRTLQDGDIVLEISGGTSERPTGRTLFITETLLQQVVEPVIPASFCRLMRVNPALAEPQFVYYALQHLYTEGGTWKFQNQSTGLSNFQFEVFKASYSIPVISRHQQRAIAEVLGALDDKIAANSRQLAVIQDLSQTTFQQARRLLPVELKTLGEVADIGGGGTPKTGTPEYWEGSVAWATPTDVTGLAAPYLSSTKRTLTNEGLVACSSPLHSRGSILMTSRATIGAFAISQRPMAVNQGFIVVNAHDPALQWWLFHEMQARVDEFLTFANGATFLELPRGRFKNLPFAVPRPEVAQAFDAFVSPLHGRAIAIVAENDRLAGARDELLPLLMSGRIAVRDATAHL